MDEIASSAGVSKRTIYAHFGNKQELFRAIVTARSNVLLAPLQAASDADESPAETLRRFSRQIVEHALQPDAVALHRLIVAESPRFPELAISVYEAGPGPSIDTLASYLAAQQRRGRLSVAEPRLAAEQFLGLLFGPIHFRVLLGLDPAPAGFDLQTAISAAVDSFLSVHAVDLPEGPTKGLES